MSAISNLTEAWQGHSFSEVETLLKNNLGGGIIVLHGTFDMDGFYYPDKIHEIINYVTAGKIVILIDNANKIYCPVICADKDNGTYWIIKGGQITSVMD